MDYFTHVQLLNVLSWITFGFVAGTIAHFLMPMQISGGIITTSITGMMGALMGGFLASIIFGTAILRFDLPSLAIAVAGSLLLVALQKLLFGHDDHIKTSIHLR